MHDAIPHEPLVGSQLVPLLGLFLSVFIYYWPAADEHCKQLDASQQVLDA